MVRCDLIACVLAGAMFKEDAQSVKQWRHAVHGLVPADVELAYRVGVMLTPSLALGELGPDPHALPEAAGTALDADLVGTESHVQWCSAASAVAMADEAEALRRLDAALGR